jgi:hypothetical protein
MSRFGFVGGTYISQSVNADAQECINWYVENVESGDGKSARVLYPTPGLSVFGAAAGLNQVRGLWTINGRTFAVIDAQLYEVLGNGNLNALGGVNNDGNPVSMVASPQQLLIASGGLLYVYFLQAVTISGVLNPAGTFTPIPAATFPSPVPQVTYDDGFFVALVSSSEKYFVSNLFDATTWQAIQSTTINTFPDNVVSMLPAFRQIWLFGQKQTEVDYDAGNLFPFSPVPGGFMEQGCGAQFATVLLDNAPMWIGARNDQGNAVAWRANGYQPVRISTHAVETAWQSYQTIADARAFAYQDQGHSFWVINFPSAQATWVYDPATGLWHRRGYWNAQQGVYQAALPQCHTFNFGKHLVGDRQSGKIYQMSIPTMTGGGWNFVTDNGNPIRRLRRAPHISSENEWIRHSYLWVDVESGVSPQPPLRDGANNPRDPMLTLRYSDDGGHTWSMGRDMGFGQAGKYKTRAKWNQLGRSRDRVYELTCADPVPCRIIDAYLKAKGKTSRFETQERLPKQMSKVA